LVGIEGIVTNGHAFLITLLHFKTMVAMATKIEAKACCFFFDDIFQVSKQFKARFG